jgi:hypothetical protein
MHSERKPVIGPMMFEELKYLYEEMKITDKCVFTEGRPQNFKEPTAEGDNQMSYSSNNYTAQILPVRT